MRYSIDDCWCFLRLALLLDRLSMRVSVLLHLILIDYACFGLHDVPLSIGGELLMLFDMLFAFFDSITCSHWIFRIHFFNFNSIL